MKHSKTHRISRRAFVKTAGSALALGAVGIPPVSTLAKRPSSPIKIKRVDADFEREPLNPYRFKGSAITNSWQTIAFLESESGLMAKK